MEDDRQQEPEGAGPERADDARRRLRDDLEALRAQVAEMLAAEDERPAGADVREEVHSLREQMQSGFATVRLEMEIAEARRLRDEMDRMLSGLVRDLRDVADRIAGR